VDAQPAVSFLIINKNDPGIRDTLRALAGVSSPLVSVRETLVVDASDERAGDYRAEFPDVHWVPFTRASDKPTIPEQRNVAVRRSSGDILVFIDASCVPDERWLDELVAPIVNEGERAVAGSYRSLGAEGIRDEDARILGTPRYLREAPTMNLAVVRSIFDEIGGFDESFSYGSDVDFTWRLNDAGIGVRYAPKAVVRHEWGAVRSEVKRSWVYGKARYRLYAKHRRRRGKVLREDPVAVVYPALLLALPAAVIQPLVLALFGALLLRNRGKRPFLTVAHHLVYGAGVLAAAWDDARARVRSA
jgi:glycosyltransferase involved in cell wall biosynthesis